MGPFYTRKPEPPRESSSSYRRPGAAAATQPARTCDGPEARAPRTFRRHRSSRVSSFCHAGVLALAARQPAGAGSAQIHRSIAPNRRRVRWRAASNTDGSGLSMRLGTRPRECLKLSRACDHVPDFGALLAPRDALVESPGRDRGGAAPRAKRGLPSVPCGRFLDAMIGAPVRQHRGWRWPT